MNPPPPRTTAPCDSFVLFNGSAEESKCMWPMGHIGCHSTFVDRKKIKWPAERSLRQGEVDALQAQVEGMRAALEKLSRLGNEPNLGNSTGNKIAQDALANLTSPSSKQAGL